jgi:succinoglycan biosynthesis protein ExoO
MELTKPSSEPRVSVIVPVHNGAEFIHIALNSALAQTEQDLEVIVVDDASTDATCAVVEQYCQRDPRIRLIRSESQGGPARARNIGFDAASGEWLAILDADDWYTEDRLRCLLAEAELEDYPFVADNQFFIRSEFTVPHRRLVRQGKDRSRPIDPEALLVHDRLGKTASMGLLKPIIRRQLLIDHNLRYDERLTVGEDFIFLLDCLRCIGPLLLVLDPHYFYRIHQKSISTSPSVDRIIPQLDALNRQVELFDAETYPGARWRLEKRQKKLTQYIRYKSVVEPLHHGNFAGVFQRLAADPSAALLLLQSSVRHLERGTRVVWAQCHQIFHWTMKSPPGLRFNDSSLIQGHDHGLSKIHQR